LAVRATNAILYDFASNFVGNELTFIDIRFSEQSNFRLIFNVFSENVARGNVGKFVSVRNFRSLRTFTRAGRAK
jgi:hypothetical protein